MNSSGQNQIEDDQSSDDEPIIVEDSESKVRMLERYIVTKNRKLKKLIRDHDYRSIIDLSCQTLTDHDMAIILKYAVLGKKCQGLNLWGNQFKAESIFILTNILNGNRTLRELDLSYNQLKNEGVRTLCDVLALNTCVIKEIDLSSNGITDKGVEYIADMLQKNEKLRALVLNHNEITDKGLMSLADALVNEKNKKLTQLKLESNPLITRTGVEYTLNLLKDKQIFQRLYVKDCSVLDKDWDRLEDMACTTGFDVIVRN